MYKTMALYTEPGEADKSSFEEHYFNVHVPLCQKLPGIVRAEVNKLSSTPGGATPVYYMITELVFNSKEEMDAAFATPEGKAVFKDTRNFPQGIMTVATAEVTQ